MWAAPKPIYVPAVWRYSDARAALDAAASFISPEQAERRNLILVNPIPGNIYPTCRHLVGAYQLVLPGETAHAHRHTPNALRLILDVGPETYTVVNGTRVDLAEGDIVLTPSWHWHAHSNFGDKTAFWIDVLDVPLIQNLESMFFQHHPDEDEKITGNDPNSPLRFKGADIAAQTKESGEVEIAPGGLKTISIHSVGFRPGQKRAHDKRTINVLYAVTGGNVKMTIENLGDVTLTRGDFVVVPCWHEHAIEGVAEWSTLVRITDEPAMNALGFSEVPTS
jgi:gentisate 1,2-dioxygenase